MLKPTKNPVRLISEGEARGREEGFNEDRLQLIRDALDIKYTDGTVLDDLLPSCDMDDLLRIHRQTYADIDAISLRKTLRQQLAEKPAP